jgi:hypothetical protein
MKAPAEACCDEDSPWKVEHIHQAEKIEALCNAVLNSVPADAPDADTQAIILNLFDQFHAVAPAICGRQPSNTGPG